jgi:wyosine [tRNA(Phe)-imidazoG37] synthetase (radical SAM superfamily)
VAYTFGPVPSRRLGRSLGVDLVPFKTCTYDCIYCQLGRTTNKTLQRREWVPLDDVVAEVRTKLDIRPDCITLSGSGEPTLYSRIEELIGRIHSFTSIPVAVLTNGSLLWQPQVRRQLIGANLVLPSLDAGDERTFQAVNRPHDGIRFDVMLEGLIAFRQAYRGAYWLEVFLLKGYTADEPEVQRLVECIRRIRPDRVQLNTATRPTAEERAVAVDPQRMAEIAGYFDPPAEVIASYHGTHAQRDFLASRDSVLEMISRRPCSLEDIVEGLGLHRNEVVKSIEELDLDGRIQKRRIDGRLFYSGKHP